MLRRRVTAAAGGGEDGDRASDGSASGAASQRAQSRTVVHTHTNDVTGIALENTGMQALGASPSITDLYQLASEDRMVATLLRPNRGAAGDLAPVHEGADAHPPADDEAAPPDLFATALPLIRQGCSSMIDDSFTRCFKSAKSVPWNWNAYLFPVWAAGVATRYLLLFPLRALALMTGFGLFFVTFPIVKMLGNFIDVLKWETYLIQLLASAFVVSWSGVIRFHGLRPTPRPGGTSGIFVANHSSMIDFILLLQSHPYAVVGQKHPGWVGYLQDAVLTSMNCIWFDRAEANDRKVVADRLRRHAWDPAKAGCPMLVFPEGTCVNNEFVVQFKKGVFELGVPINPIAIKYNKVFVDGYWNSRQQSFAQHLIRLMTSWAVVCDIWFLDQQTLQPGEDPAEFAKRVQYMIAARAGLKAVDWDGYMKYWKPSERLVEKGKTAVAQELIEALGLSEDSPAEGAASLPDKSAGGVKNASAAAAASTPSDMRLRAGSSGSAAPSPALNAVPGIPTVPKTIVLGSAAASTPLLMPMSVPLPMPSSNLLGAAALSSTNSSNPGGFEIGDDESEAAAEQPVIANNVAGKARRDAVRVR